MVKKLFKIELPAGKIDPPRLNRVKSYLDKRVFFVSLENFFSEKGQLDYGVPQGSILGPLLFLIYINDIPQALSKCDVYLYADDTSLLFMDKDIEKIEKVLNEEFASLCEWFVDNKLSIHFGEDKTKCILFTKKKKHRGLNICYDGNSIKEHRAVEYLGCILDANFSGEPMPIKVIKKINSKLSFLYRQGKYLDTRLRRLLCNALIQPHFDYGCTSWYPLINKRLKSKLQVAQNKCIRFCLNLSTRSHISHEEFKNINWLPTKDRVEQCIALNVFKYWKKTAPSYVYDLYTPSFNLYNTRRSQMALDIPLKKTSLGQKSMSFLGPSIWNKLNISLKSVATASSFTHSFKKHILKTTSSP